MIAEYLQELLTQKAYLAENLKIKGVDADASETLNTLVPKVLNIQNGGGYNQNHPLNGWFEEALEGLTTDTAP